MFSAAQLRLVRLWRRAAVAVLAAAFGVTSVACEPDLAPPCTDAYEHLLGLGRRNHDPDLQLRFIQACTESLDPDRVACLQAATSPEAALACHSQKKRPG